MTVLSAELGDDPHGPGKRFRRMRVLLERGHAFASEECVQGLDFGGRKSDPGVLFGSSITRLDKLHDGAANHAPGHRRILDPMGGQKPPQGGLGTRRRIHLADLDKADFHRLGQPRLPGQIGGAIERAHFFLKTGQKRATNLAVQAGRPERARNAVKAMPAICRGAEESLPPPSLIERSAIARVRM